MRIGGPDEFDFIRRVMGSQPTNDPILEFFAECESAPINTVGLHPIYETLSNIVKLSMRRDTLSANPMGLPENVITPYFMNTVLSIAENFSNSISQAKNFANESGWGQMTVEKLFLEIMEGLPDAAQEILPNQKINNFNGAKLAILLLALSDNIRDIVSERQGVGDLSTHEVIMDTYLDEVRAKKFLSALKVAVQTMEKEKPDGIIHVLDAGCGPLPIFGMYASLFSPRVKCVCLEKNPTSARLAQKTVQKLSFKPNIEVLNVDATTYKVEQKPDILISETLYSGLANEPFVKIMDNLYPQMRKGGIVIPEEVKIFGGVTTFEQVSAENRKTRVIGLSTSSVTNCNWKLVKTYRPGERLEIIDFNLPIPPNLINEEVLGFVSGEVVCAKGIVLGKEESLITASGPITLFDNISTRNKNRIHVRYEPGKQLQGNFNT